MRRAAEQTGGAEVPRHDDVAFRPALVPDGLTTLVAAGQPPPDLPEPGR